MSTQTITGTSDAPPAPDAVEAAQFRARMARAGAGPTGAPARRPRTGPGERRGSGLRLGWKSWLAIDCAVVLLVVAAVVAWPPLRACRHQGETVGFYAGDSVERCVRRGIGERLTQADQRVKMLIRGSGR